MKRVPVVALSVAEAPGQTELGYGEEHLLEALVRIGRLLLRQGCHFAYGGDLRPGGFTELLLHLVRAENSDGALALAGKRQRSEQMRRMVDFLAWPNYGKLGPDLQARYLGVCRFVKVDPPVGMPAPPNEDEGSLWFRLRASLALSAMRRAMQFGGATDVDRKPVRGASARLVMGGRVERYSGLMPGIFEEVAWALRAGTREQPMPVFVLGGFGGAAGVIREGLIAKKVPDELTLDWHVARDPTLQKRMLMLEGDKRCAKVVGMFHPKHQFGVLQQACREGVGGLARRNGLGKKDNERLLESSDLTEVLGALSRAQALRR